MQPKTAPRAPRRNHAFALIFLVTGFTSTATTPLIAQPTNDHAVDSSAFQPIQSSARAAADIVREAGRRRSLETKTAPGAPQGAATSQSATLSVVERSATKGGGGGNYSWEQMQSWLPGERGIQWCVSGFQSVEPVGGVKLYRLSQPYAGLRSLQPFLLAVTLKAQEQLPAPHPTGSTSGGMQHEFAYGTCVTPEFTKVGTYVTATSFCGSRKECAQNPHVSATTLVLKPFVVSFNACINRSAGMVEVFLSTLYLDQRPTPASVELRFDGAPMPGAKASPGWPWMYVDYSMPLAEYESRFGTGGDSTIVSIASDNAHTPTAELSFSKSDWLDPCRE
jgi:hypothetical protein